MTNDELIDALLNAHKAVMKCDRQAESDVAFLKRRLSARLAKVKRPFAMTNRELLKHLELYFQCNPQCPASGTKLRMIRLRLYGDELTTHQDWAARIKAATQRDDERCDIREHENE